MSLTRLWQSSRTELENKHIQQIIAFAGQGKLLDGNSACAELREFLGLVSSEILCRYAEECLTSKFEDSGFALQDIINQIGVRLGFRVEFGRYRGVKNEIGHDGLWRFPDNHSVVAEVKTTDAYRIDSGKIADYRKKLIVSGEIEEEKSSILIVVGRQDTGDLEAQIRGSRYAWEIRLISVDALLRLMLLKETVDDPRIIEKICAILIPREFTRLDEIVEIVFFAAEEAKSNESADEDIEEVSLGIGKIVSKPVAFHDACIDRFANKTKALLVKRTRNTWASPNGDISVVCVVSKVHGTQLRTAYWFAFHPHQKDFLKGSANGFLVLGCGSKNQVMAIPFAELEGWLDGLWTTEYEDRMYWHIRVRQENSKLFLDRKKGIGRLEVTKYLI